jgi:hypothetical protein
MPLRVDDEHDEDDHDEAELRQSDICEHVASPSSGLSDFDQ